MKPVQKAFLIAPLVPAAIYALIAMQPALLFVAIPVSYVCTLAIGVPLYFLVRRFGQVSWLSCSLGGAAAGALVSVALALLEGSFEPSFYFAKGIFFFAVFSAIAGIAFWCVARTPNKALKKDARETTRAS